MCHFCVHYNVIHVSVQQIKEEMSKDAQEKYAQFEIVCKEKGRNRYIVREFLTGKLQPTW